MKFLFDFFPVLLFFITYKSHEDALRGFEDTRWENRSLIISREAIILPVISIQLSMMLEK